MIQIGSRFLIAEHIQYIHIDPISDQLYTVTVEMTGCIIVFGKGKSDVMDRIMAIEFFKRIIQAISHYKSSDTPEIQFVNMPTYKEMHPKEESETQ